VHLPHCYSRAGQDRIICSISAVVVALACRKAETEGDSILEREPDQRKAYIDAACAGDASLRKEVESLPACQPEAKGFFRKVGEVRTGSPIPNFGDRGVCSTFLPDGQLRFNRSGRDKGCPG
jgi:hypothetical protein